MNILVTGAAGQLGSEIRRIVSAGESGTGNDRYIFSDVAAVPGEDTLYLDITNPDAIGIVVSSEKIDVIVNCAAYTNVDKAESDSSFADLLNHKAPENLARAAERTGATLIHISTDYVFGGENFRPYRESDEPDPKGVYGATKYAGERAVVSSGCRHIIIRTAWLYSEYGKNFVKTMLERTVSDKTRQVVSDQIGTPTYALDLARAIVTIISDRMLDRTGIYHYTDEGVASWYDFAKAVNDFAGHGCEVLPCRTEDYPSKVCRPHYSVLDKSLFKSTFGIGIPHWTESLRACISGMHE